MIHLDAAQSKEFLEDEHAFDLFAKKAFGFNENDLGLMYMKHKLSGKVHFKSHRRHTWDCAKKAFSGQVYRALTHAR